MATASALAAVRRDMLADTARQTSGPPNCAFSDHVDAALLTRLGATAPGALTPDRPEQRLITGAPPQSTPHRPPEVAATASSTRRSASSTAGAQRGLISGPDGALRAGRARTHSALARPCSPHRFHFCIRSVHRQYPRVALRASPGVGARCASWASPAYQVDDGSLSGADGMVSVPRRPRHSHHSDGPLPVSRPSPATRRLSSGDLLYVVPRSTTASRSGDCVSQNHRWAGLAGNRRSSSAHGARQFQDRLPRWRCPCRIRAVTGGSGVDVEGQGPQQELACAGSRPCSSGLPDPEY